MNDTQFTELSAEAAGLIVGLAFVVGSSIWVAKDAKANRITLNTEPYSANNGAAAWFFSCLLLWIASFPYYLIRRSAVLRQRRNASSAPGPTTNNVVALADAEEELRKLARLKQDGIITEADFDQKKKKVLGL
jgi:Short C-terminal domain